MPFYRFEDFEANYLTPDLSTGKGPVIEGRYMYFCLVHKNAGSGSELHYHPNELLIFPLRGRINAIVGKDRRIVGPGTFIHAPAYARHSMKATEEGHCQYLYIKDKTWTVVGLAAEEAVPEKAMTVEEINRLHREGAVSRVRKDPGKSRIIIEGLNDCFYPIIGSLEAAPRSGRCVSWIEGERLAFGFFEVPSRYEEPEMASAREMFLYVLDGKVQAQVDGDSRLTGAGDIIHVPRGARYRLQPISRDPVRYALVCSTPFLENRIDRMTPEEQEQARLNLKSN